MIRVKTVKHWGNKRDRRIRYGTFNKSDLLNGFGGKIRIWSKTGKDPLTYDRIYIWEGQFENDSRVHGFGRTIVNGMYVIGWAKNRLPHGYSKIQKPNGDIKEGHFEKGKLRGEKVTTYDREKDFIA